MTRQAAPRRRPAGTRGQSEVVGLALMLAVTIVALGTVTAAVGTVVQGNAASADAARVAAGFDGSIDAVESTGPSRGRVSFTSGEVRVAERQLRVFRGGSVVRTVPVDALVYERGQQRTIYLAGAVIRETGASARLYAEPAVTASAAGGADGVLVVGAPTLNTSDRTVSSTGSTTLLLETDVTHDRTDLGNGTYAVAVETTTPRPWERYFRRQGADVTRRDLDGDGTDSVVARFPGRRVAYLVVHDLRLEVRVGG